MRFSNHLQSAELERDLLKMSQEKTAHLATMAAVADRRGDAVVFLESDLIFLHTLYSE